MDACDDYSDFGAKSDSDTPSNSVSDQEEDPTPLPLQSRRNFESISSSSSVSSNLASSIPSKKKAEADPLIDFIVPYQVRQEIDTES